MESNCMLTTFDNPFDPFEQFTQWFLLDVEKGYNTCGKLGRIVKLNDSMTQKEEDEAINNAIDEIIKYDFMNIYKKVNKKETVA